MPAAELPWTILSSESSGSDVDVEMVDGVASSHKLLDSATEPQNEWLSTHDSSKAACHHRNFGTIVDALKCAAAVASASSTNASRYLSVNVLLLQWEVGDLGVEDEVQRLSETFGATYGFRVENWRIPTSQPTLKLNQKISSWVETHQSDSNLFILYYAGHARIDEGRQVIWHNIRDHKDSQFAHLRWSNCEDMLHESHSDTLFLLDCCAAAGSASRPLTGFSETIAASGFETFAPPPGPHSFTNALIRVLQKWRGRAFSISKLHAEVLLTLKEMPPEQISTDGSSFEWRRTPVHYIRSSHTCPPSILMAPLGDTNQDGLVTLYEEPRAVPEHRDFPRVVLSITLTEDIQDDDAADCRRWLASFPIPTKEVTVEAVFHGFSTIILLSLPLEMWDCLPDIPGCNFVCYITSSNLLYQEIAPSSGKCDADTGLSSLGVRSGSSEGIPVITRCKNQTLTMEPMCFWQLCFWQLCFWQLCFWQLCFWQLCFWQLCFWQILAVFLLMYLSATLGVSAWYSRQFRENARPSHTKTMGLDPHTEVIVLSMVMLMFTCFLIHFSQKWRLVEVHDSTRKSKA